MKLFFSAAFFGCLLFFRICFAMVEIPSRQESGCWLKICDGDRFYENEAAFQYLLSEDYLEKSAYFEVVRRLSADQQREIMVKLYQISPDEVDVLTSFFLIHWGLCIITVRMNSLYILR